MSDWMEQLERLAQLRDQGLLTEDEFAEQKRRLLDAQATPPAGTLRVESPAQAAPYASDGYSEPDEPKSSKLPWIIAGLAALLAVSAAAWFGSGLLPRGADPALTDGELDPSPSPSASALASPAPTPTPTASATPIAVDRYLAFSDSAECISGSDLEEVYERLDDSMAAGGGTTAQVPGLADPLKITTAVKGDGETTTQFAEASVRFPESSGWNGLVLSRIKAERVSPPESDSAYTRSVIFKNSVPEVRAAMRRLGLPDAQRPAFRELKDTYGGCGGAGYVEAVPGGAALVCSWGC